MDDDEPQ